MLSTEQEHTSPHHGLNSQERAHLAQVVIQVRRLLEEDLLRQRLQGDLGIHADGNVEPESALPADPILHQLRKTVLDYLEHVQSQGHTPAEAVRLLVLETTFTWLNRLTALRLLEERGVFRQALGRGLRSAGFIHFLAEDQEAYQLHQVERRQNEAYLRFLLHLCRQMSRRIQVLFDTEDAPGRLTPSPATLVTAVEMLNDPLLANIWQHDETIGWVYQFFPPREMREEARQQSPAPRNREELAFRNQFYTPRYVVEYLADNALAAQWVARVEGRSALVDQCAMLLHPQDGWPSLPPLDPRELTVLDPACGSGHFLLYSFDLLQTIYQEAYQDPQVGAALRNDFPDPSAFQREIPRLILHHNLYGVDIDVRAAQIAALALYLRAQRAWQTQGLPGEERPMVEQVHIAIAEPMPGEVDLLNEFVRGLRGRVATDEHHLVLGKLVRSVWHAMRQAGELGSLLRIEETLHAAVEEARQEWPGAPLHPVQVTVHDGSGEMVQPVLDLGAEADADFWEAVEELVLEALADYAEQYVNGHGSLRRVFSRDAARGFAFIDTMRRRYHVVLMNPPFGAPTPASKAYLQKQYPRTKQDLYAAFVERGLELLQPGGRLGAITSRTGFFLKTFQKWREEILMQESHLVTLADLGYGVLDTAMVETAAYVVEKPRAQG